MGVDLVKKMSKTELKKMSTIIYEHIYYGLKYRQTPLDKYRTCMKFYFGEQLTSREKEILSLKGQEHFIVNHLRPSLKSLQGFLTANKPSWNVMAVADDDSFVRKISNGMMTYIWDNSTGYHKVYRVTRNGIVGGIGSFITVIDYRRNGGLGDVLIKDLPFENYIPDWRVRDPFDPFDRRFDGVITTDYITKAIALRPDLRNRIVNEFSLGYDPEFTLVETDNFIVGTVPETDSLNTDLGQYVEYYRLYESKTFKVIDKWTGDVYRTIYEPEIVYPSNLEVETKFEPVLEKYLCLYNGSEVLILSKDVFPITRPIISNFIDEDTDNLYPLGEVFFAKDLQRWLNKSYQQTLLHTQIANNPLIFVDKNEDTEEIEKKRSVSGSVIGIDMQKGSPYAVQPQQVQSGWYQLIRDFSQEIRNSMGTFAPFTGDPSYSKGNATETLLLQEKGAERAKVIFRNFELALEGAGKAAWEMAKYHYDFPMWLSWLDEQQRPNRVFLNGAVVGESSEGELEMKELKLKDIDVDIKLVASSYQPVNGMAHTQILMDMYRIAPDYARDPIFVKMLQYLQIDQDIIDKVKQNSEIVPRLMQQLQLQGQQIERLEQLLKGAQTRAMAQDEKVARKEIGAELQGQLSKARAEIAVAKEKAKLDILNTGKT